MFSDDWGLFIEGVVPQTKKLASFEKVEFLRVLFHFCIHTSVGFARVLIDAEKKFQRDDKFSFLKIMLEQSRKVNSIIVNWDSQNFFRSEAEREQENAKNKKKTGW
mmetsp:Transcript_18971/g.21259  ORF Transcript_18971/g.21259 Transcript_18971/m.21259 type:complete len:106 (+) Transcript_18971:554-871(+)